jgi:hypothetical protein
VVIPVIAHHFCDASRSVTLNVARFIQSIAVQIASSSHQIGRLVRPKLRGSTIERALTEKRCLDDPASSFEEGVLAPLRTLKGITQHVAIVVDGLDESFVLEHMGGIDHVRADSFDRNDESSCPHSPASSVQSVAKPATIPSLLATTMSQFPSWLTLIGSSRPNISVIESFDRATASMSMDVAQRQRYLVDMTSRTMTTHFSECGRRLCASSPLAFVPSDVLDALRSGQTATATLGRATLRSAMRSSEDCRRFVVEQLKSSLLKERARRQKMEQELRAEIRSLQIQNQELKDSLAAYKNGWVCGGRISP